jgi:hypothetical protein
MNKFSVRQDKLFRDRWFVGKGEYEFGERVWKCYTNITFPDKKSALDWVKKANKDLN